MLNVEERKRLQDKLVLLNGKELDEVDAFVEELFIRRRRVVELAKE